MRMVLKSCGIEAFLGSAWTQKSENFIKAVNCGLYLSLFALQLYGIYYPRAGESDQPGMAFIREIPHILYTCNYIVKVFVPLTPMRVYKQNAKNDKYAFYLLTNRIYGISIDI